MGTAAHVLVSDLDDLGLDDHDRHHLASVLRLRSGEAVGATDGRGGYRLCRWSGIGLEADGPTQRSPQPAPQITIGLTPVKGERTEWAVQKLTEVGVDRVVLLRSARSVVRWEGDRAAAQLGRLRRVARQALMQSRGCWLPEVDGVLNPGMVGGALADPAGEPPTLGQPSVLIGPEGGWSDEERDSAPALVRLGPSVLRAETAAVAAAVLLTGLRDGLVWPSWDEF